MQESQKMKSQKIRDIKSVQLVRRPFPLKSTVFIPTEVYSKTMKRIRSVSNDFTTRTKSFSPPSHQERALQNDYVNFHPVPPHSSDLDLFPAINYCVIEWQILISSGPVVDGERSADTR